MQKPGYGLTRQAFWISFILAWLVIGAIVAGGLRGSREAVDLAGITVPSMIALIAALLGIHRAFGSMDYRSAAANLPRDQPSDGLGEVR
ncbi:MULTISPECIES: NAD(P)+ transhydrogenase beta chain [unclassified Ensifer]|uniref:NAD(P)+ transhydrogenase beta chain n=1 Tax=unclassified Ensifer TaxID=2633371 RepID=UPI000812E752|nr:MULTISPECIES: NAD(P)+ transhydrogenase beta chain [unclassified Ensifer]OCP17453.1 NAD(P)+ transhydrogenase beta chain [Ensifer sp. LC54]OCP28641.1 NAD(P)+ transhydrogenase beta chain [Ensifer sp. LC384]